MANAPFGREIYVSTLFLKVAARVAFCKEILAEKESLVRKSRAGKRLGSGETEKFKSEIAKGRKGEIEFLEMRF
jgi:hypothetical protein